MLDDDPLWYQDAIIYEVHVRAFHDSDGDGIGDFRGLTQRLDYLRDLGVSALWLLPFYPSPLRDDGYDIADYTDVHSSYGSLRDFETFLAEAHRRGMRVITELVLNHTSDQHPWFQRARRAAPGTPERDFYVWTDTPGAGETPRRYREARVIFQDFEPSNWTWDPVARAYYWHRFFSHQPDLNYANPAVRAAILPMVDFWLDRGVDGLRLDAVPYLFEREGTSCENLPETYEFLKELRRHIDARYSGRMLLAEANQWPEDAAAYFGAGDACHMAFHFPLMPRLFMAVQMEDRFPILDILYQTPPIPEGCQWALFLRNHDELTLEMVTDEERDYMNRVYAHDPQARINLGIRRRLAPLMGNDRRRIELMNSLLFALPGTPVIYYGDEIGMGDNIYLGDRNAVRTPMQWGPDRNAGFSRANPQRLYLPVIIDPEYHFEALNVEAQQDNPHSLLSWMKRLIAQRARFRALGRGSLEFLRPANHRILAFLRRHENEQLLIVANLSRSVQYVELDLSAFRGLVPVEVFGRSEFPPIGELPYLLTAGPHEFYWFSLESRTKGQATGDTARLPRLAVAGGWERMFVGSARSALEGALGDYLARGRFGEDARRPSFVELRESVRVPVGDPGAVYLVLVTVAYFEGDPATFQVPLAFAEGSAADRLLADRPELGIARVSGDVEGLVYDALGAPGFGRALVAAMAAGTRFPGEAGEALASGAAALAPRWAAGEADSEPRLMEGGRGQNAALVFGDRLFLKLFRRTDEGVHPGPEVGRFLNDRGFPHVPPWLGLLEYRRGRGRPVALASLQGYVPHRGDARRLALEALVRYYDRILTKPEAREVSTPQQSMLALAEAEAMPSAAEAVGAFLDVAHLIGRRTGQLHRALASDRDDPAFAPEPFTGFHQRSVYQSMRGRAGRALRRLESRIGGLTGADRAEAEALLGRWTEVQTRFRQVLGRTIRAERTRMHGDYHLGQLLDTGGDFVIIDFEGDAARHLGERRLKGSPLRDVAGMLLSFHHAACSSLPGPGDGSGEPSTLLEPWARSWTTWVGAAFLRGYLSEAGGASFLPQDRDELAILLDVFLLDQALGSLGHELIHRPDRAWISLRAVGRSLEGGPRVIP